MAQSVIEICNSALFKIGANRINALTDGTKEANACNERFEPCKRAVLRMHPWNTTKRVTLPALSETPEFGFSNIFQLPGDFIRLVAVSPDSEPDYKIEGNRILCDDSTIDVKYVWDVNDPTLLDALLSEAIAAYLAWDISYAITQNLALKDQLKTDMKLAISKARFVDSTEDPSPEVEADYFIDSRVGPVGGAGPIARRNW